MQSRKDQVQAYFFVVGRMVSAVTAGRPETLTPPNRRLSTGIALSIMLAALLVAIFGIYGLFVPGGNTSWRKPGAIVLDTDTGARFLYLDDQLRPVLNFASARLASGNTDAPVSVSGSSLVGTPVGQPVGIPNAPDALPNAAKLDSGAWTLCTQSPEDTTSTGAPTVTLLFGRPPGDPLPDDAGLVVATPDGSRYLLWQGRRHRLADASVVAQLNYGRVVPVPVTPAWLNPIPPGRDFAVPPTPLAGAPGPVVEGRQSRVGQVFEVRNPAIGSDQYYLMRIDGAAPLSGTSAALVLAARSTAAAYPGTPVTPIQVGPSALSSVPVSPGSDLVNGLPAKPPTAAVPAPGTQPCVRYTSDQSGTQAVPELREVTDVDAGAVPVARHLAGTMADRVSIPTGSGVLAREQAAGAGGPGPAFLVTDIGARFPLADDQTISALGYAPASAVSVPPSLLDLLPTGPVLSAAAARQDQAP